MFPISRDPPEGGTKIKKAAGIAAFCEIVSNF